MFFKIIGHNYLIKQCSKNYCLDFLLLFSKNFLNISDPLVPRLSQTLQQAGMFQQAFFLELSIAFAGYSKTIIIEISQSEQALLVLNKIFRNSSVLRKSLSSAQWYFPLATFDSSNKRSKHDLMPRNNGFRPWSNLTLPP